MCEGEGHYHDFLDWWWPEPDAPPRPNPGCVEASYGLELRPRSQWNSLGREIFNAENQRKLADCTTDILAAVAPLDYVVLRAHSAWPWVGDGDGGEYVACLMEFFARLGADARAFTGGLHVSRSERDLRDSLRMFVNYSSLLEREDVYVYSCRKPLGVILLHHMDTLWWSSERSCLQGFADALSKRGCDVKWGTGGA